MSQFNLNKNLMQLRYKKGITQEKLADFLGVSKASVSKWETGQSLPDIAQLPRLAAYYDVSIDELMGYEGKLSMKEVKEHYVKFAERFSAEEFDKVLADVKDFIRIYYSCDIALFQMVVLLMNHLMMADPAKQPELLEEMIQLCEHIRDISEDVDLCDGALLFEANLELMRGNPNVTIEKLEYTKKPFHMSKGHEVLLTQAYQMTGRVEEAREWNQVAMYKDIMNLLQNGINYMMGNLQDKERTGETISRLDKVVEAYDIQHLNTNAFLQYLYVKAMYYTTWQMPDKAIKILEAFVEDAVSFLENDPKLHGDAYFDKLDGYYARMDDYVMLPRDRQTVLSDLGAQLTHPAFAPLFELEEYQALLKKLTA